jgi:hypothetical protein
MRRDPPDAARDLPNDRPDPGQYGEAAGEKTRLPCPLLGLSACRDAELAAGPVVPVLLTFPEYRLYHCWRWLYDNLVEQFQNARELPAFFRQVRGLLD